MANLDNIKVGDLVIFSMGGWYTTTIIDKVAKVTSKQFEVGAYRFWKKDGSMVGDNFKRCRIATEKDIADFKAEKYRNRLCNTIHKFFSSYKNVEQLTIEEMEKIESVINNKLK